MELFNQFLKLISRFRYPVSLPENIAEALGIELSNFLTFENLLQTLSEPNFRPTKLYKFMPREAAEKAFSSALRKDYFQNKSFFSYLFNDGWLEFVLIFDEESRLRRVYMQHKYLPDENGVEIHLSNDALKSLD